VASTTILTCLSLSSIVVFSYMHARSMTNNSASVVSRQMVGKWILIQAYRRGLYSHHHCSRIDGKKLLKLLLIQCRGGMETSAQRTLYLLGHGALSTVDSHRVTKLFKIHHLVSVHW
jgi:hypothetical protein